MGGQRVTYSPCPTEAQQRELLGGITNVDNVWGVGVRTFSKLCTGLPAPQPGRCVSRVTEQRPSNPSPSKGCNVKLHFTVALPPEVSFCHCYYVIHVAQIITINLKVINCH